jgi:hypothetical protein
MRKLINTTATAISLGIMALASPAMADQSYGPRGGQAQHERQFQHDRHGSAQRHQDWGRHDRGFDQWERGWGRSDRAYGHHERTLSQRQIIRRLERQGFYGVRGLREARWGWGLRAFAHDRRGRPVMLRVNPYSGRVMDVRYV